MPTSLFIVILALALTRRKGAIVKAGSTSTHELQHLSQQGRLPRAIQAGVSHTPQQRPAKEEVRF